MKGFAANIEASSLANVDFRRVLYTGSHLQLVLMSLRPGQEIGEEVHADRDQFFRVEAGRAEIQIDGAPTPLRAGDAAVVPAGARHNVINTGDEDLKLYTLYGPPEHRDGVIHHTPADAHAAHEHFDGKTTE